MIKNHKFLSLFAITLMAALLLCMGSKATSVYALADPVAVSPVFDTQIYQLADYIDQMPEPSVDVFFLLTGVLVASQLGGQQFKLEDPYATSSDVIDWFKSLGIRFYNTVIGLYPNQDPILGFDVRPYIKPLMAALMGNAVIARNYNGIDDFMESDDDVLMPFKRDIQDSINKIWQIQGGLYHWQFEESPFRSNDTWRTSSMTVLQQSQYDSYVAEQTQPTVRANSTQSHVLNVRLYTYNTNAFAQYTNLFFNTQDYKVYLCNDAGQSYNNPYVGYVFCNANYNGNPYVEGADSSIFRYTTPTFDISLYPTYQHIVQAFYDHDIISWQGRCTPFYEDFVQHVYFGTNWVNKQEIFNIQDLNIDDTGEEFYEAPTDDDLLIDIKNLINDLVNDTDIWTNIINNVYDPDGTHITNFPTIRVSIDLTPITELLDPPVPVNLNDVSDYMDNTYLDLVKQHGENFGETIGEYVAFWHNSDPEITYVIFGALILTLVGAFVGKWGHS